MSKRELSRLARARRRLNALLADLCSAVEASAKSRCPYLTAQGRCTFRGRCQHQRRERRVLRCAGGEFPVRPGI